MANVKRFPAPGIRSPPCGSSQALDGLSNVTGLPNVTARIRRIISVFLGSVLGSIGPYCRFNGANVYSENKELKIAMGGG